MPDGLTLRTTLLLAALAFGLTFGTQALLDGGGGASAAKPVAAQREPAPVVDEPGAEPDLRLAAAGTLPALQNPRKPPKRRVAKPARKPRPSVQPTTRPSPMAMTPAPAARPVPTAAPRYVPPAPRRVTPKPPAPKPTPAPTSPPPSGDFDTTGDS